jgi:hypothetical protein
MFFGQNDVICLKDTKRIVHMQPKDVKISSGVASGKN